MNVFSHFSVCVITISSMHQKKDTHTHTQPQRERERERERETHTRTHAHTNTHTQKLTRRNTHTHTYTQSSNEISEYEGQRRRINSPYPAWDNCSGEQQMSYEGCKKKKKSLKKENQEHFSATNYMFAHIRRNYLLIMRPYKNIAIHSMLFFDLRPGPKCHSRWCTGRKWHILMAVMRGKRVGGNWLMKWDEVKNSHGTLID